MFASIKKGIVEYLVNLTLILTKKTPYLAIDLFGFWGIYV